MDGHTLFNDHEPEGGGKKTNRPQYLLQFRLPEYTKSIRCLLRARLLSIGKRGSAVVKYVRRSARLRMSYFKRVALLPSRW